MKRGHEIWRKQIKESIVLSPWNVLTLAMLGHAVLDLSPTYGIYQTEVFASSFLAALSSLALLHCYCFELFISVNIFCQDIEI